MEMTRLWRSKALREVATTLATRTLRVDFLNGGRYEYLDVGPEVYEGMIHSAHPWTEWREEVLGHEYRRLD